MQCYRCGSTPVSVYRQSKHYCSKQCALTTTKDKITNTTKKKEKILQEKREKKKELKSESRPIKPVPIAGRPKSFDRGGGDVASIGSHDKGEVASIDRGEMAAIGVYTKSERKAKIENYKRKRFKGPFLRYAVRKEFADSRPRIGGRFITTKQCEELKKLHVENSLLTVLNTSLHEK
jgi:hypothetical protein